MSVGDFFSSLFSDDTTATKTDDTVTTAAKQTTGAQQQHTQTAGTQETGVVGSNTQQSVGSQATDRQQTTGLAQNQTQTGQLFSNTNLDLLSQAFAKVAKAQTGPDLTALAADSVSGGVDVLSALRGRSMDPGLVDSIVNKAKESATASFKSDTLPQLSLLSGRSGSRLNSYSGLLENDARAKLAGELAGTEGNIRMQMDKQNTDTMTAALTGGNTVASGLSGVNNSNADALYRLAAVLRGGESSQITTGDQTGTLQDNTTAQLLQSLLASNESKSTQNNLQDFIQSILNSTLEQNDVNSSTTSSGNSSTNPGLWTALGAISKFMPTGP